MIRNKKDLKQYLEQDFKIFKDSPVTIKDFILKNERWYIYHFIKHLRMTEYYINKYSGGGGKLQMLFHLFWLKYFSRKMNLTIYPNTVGPGLQLFHFGDFTHIAKGCKIGKNCTILPGVVFGKKDGTEIKTTVGDDCFFGLGVKILGTVHIGNNVTIGANAVVTKDIPNNAIAGGVPARIIKIKDENKE